MSLHFISGKPGGGKSLYGVKLLVDEIRHSRRNICTNLPLKVERLAEYLHETYGETFNLHRRLRMLTEDECGDFYRHPALGVDVLENRTVKLGPRSLQVPDFAVRAETGGTFFLIDEAHIFFNAKSWQKTGEDCLYYLSQHRKLSDDIVVITQFVGNVEKQFRVLAQDFTYLRNHGKERLGMFQSLNLFQRRTFQQPATASDKPMEQGLFKLDVSGLASCYETAAGVGIHARGTADVGHRKKGLPFWVLPAVFVAGIAAVLVVGFKAPDMVGAGLNAAYQSGENQARAVHRQPSFKTSAGESGGEVVLVVTNLPVSPAAVSVRPLVSPPVAVVQALPKVVINSVMKWGDGWRVGLSDGRAFKTGVDPELIYLDKESAVIGTNVYRWR